MNIKVWEPIKVSDMQMELGEGVIWDEKEQRIYWVDILGYKIYSMTFQGDIIEIPSPDQYPSTIALDEEGNLIVSALDTIYRIDQHTYENKRICSVVYDSKLKMRFNDGKISPNGNLWVGSMSLEIGDKRSENAGHLYAIRNKQFQIKRQGVTISNGLCWDEEKSLFYFIDTPKRCIYQYDYNKDTEEISNCKVCIKIPKEDGFPDGMTIDEKGRLWIAHWEGKAVWCYNPKTSEKEEVVYLPTSRVSCVVFGDKDLSTLYITTAKDEKGNGGELYKVKVDTTGKVSYRYK